jgi:molecular chaperone GrpE
MVSFRKKKKQMRMEEKMSPQAAEPAEAEEIKVTDKRRINIDGDWDAEAPPEEPNLKPSYVEELEERARAAERTVADVQARFEQERHKMQVEIDQIRQRLNRAADERVQRVKGEFIASLLPVADNLRLAIDAAEKGSSFESLLVGVKGTASNFESALLAAGVEPVVAVGQPFDPELHEAVDIAPVEPEQDGLVTAEYQRGYKLGERLLRPARVQVGRA